MESQKNNQKLFYKLIQRQRSNPVQRLSKLVVDDVTYDTSKEIENAWADYFEKLSKATCSENFNEEYKTLVEKDLDVLRKLYSKVQVESKFTTATEIQKVIGTMSNGKAPDELSIMAEHLKNGGPIVVTILEQLFNKIYEECIIPDIFNNGIITPVFKKHGKPIYDPNSYRRITVCSIIGKVFEKLVQTKIIDILDSQQSRLQRGFTKNTPATNDGLIFTEAIADALDEGHPLYAVFIDATKAFDVVWHASLLRRLHNAGIKDNDWKILDEWYKDLTSKVKWDGSFSRIFHEEQGVRQGGILSPLLYKVFINPLLKTLEEEHLGSTIGSIHVGSPACADDILLISRSLIDLQTMLLIQEDFANSERYLLSESKSKIMIMHAKKKEVDGVNIKLHGQPLEQVDNYTHIGIQRNANKSCLISERIKLARRTSYALLGAGLHGYNGVNPEVGLKIWNTYVQPRLIFGLESVVLKRKDLDALNQFHKSMLKNLQNLPERTADAAVYLLSGQLPVETDIHYQILVRLGNILRNDCIEKEICIRQILIKPNNSNSWFIYAKNILDKYELDSIYSLIENVPSPGVWKRTVRSKINLHWKRLIENDSKTKTSLAYLNCTMIPGEIHNIWSSAGFNSNAIKKASIKARLAAGVYVLQKDRSKFYGSRENPLCYMCADGIEDQEHYILNCSKLSNIRLPFLQCLRNMVQNFSISISNFIEDNNLLLQLILDPTHPSIPIKLQSRDISKQIETISRGLCYALHRERCTKLDIKLG